MTLYLLWLTGSMAIGAVGVWIAREYAFRMDWLDHPNDRSFHDEPTPRIGGWGLLLPVLLCLMACLLIPGLALSYEILSIAIPALVVATISFFDDRFDLPRLLRLGFHILCAAIVLWLLRDAWAGNKLPLFGELLPVWLCGLLLIIWIAGLTNAFNFMDGIDGIATIQAIVILSGWIYVVASYPALSWNDSTLILLLLSTLGGCLGFLIFNWPPASIFIGDTGSTFLGFFAACLPLAFAGLGLPLETTLEAGVLFSWPFIFDTSSTFFRRLITREAVFDAHRSHLYQRFASTFSSRSTGHLMTSLLFGSLAILGLGLYKMAGPLWIKLAIIALVWTAVMLWTRLRTTDNNQTDLSGIEIFEPVSDHVDFDIFLSPPHITQLEYQYVQRALDSRYIAPVGPQLIAFEDALSKYLGLQQIQAVSSGTAAIHLGLRALGVQPGDCVICPDMTFIASCNPVRYLGAEPILVDVSNETWGIDISCLKETIQTLKSEGRTIRAIVVVHALGIPAPVCEIVELANQENIKVLEDCAGAFGTKIGGNSVGFFGDAAAFSFNGNKILTTSGGGALYVKDPSLRQDTRKWANQGKLPGVVGYEHDCIGYNYKLSNISAAIGLGQLESIESRLIRKQHVYDTYVRNLCNSDSILRMPDPDYGTCNYWLSNFGFAGKLRAMKILEMLRGAKIEASPLWKPMHVQGINSDLRYFGKGNSLSIHQNFLSLPSGAQLTEKQVDRICSIILKHLQVA